LPFWFKQSEAITPENHQLLNWAAQYRMLQTSLHYEWTKTIVALRLSYLTPWRAHHFGTPFQSFSNVPDALVNFAHGDLLF
jgi:hypothetical protein